MLKAQRDSIISLPEISNWLCSRHCATDSTGLDCSLVTNDFDGSLVTNASDAELTYGLGLTSGSSMASRGSMTNGNEIVSPMAHYVNASSGGDATMPATAGDLVPGNSGDWINHTSLMAASSAATHKFHHILMAETSPVTRRNEETLTYLNQGQSYEIKLKKIAGSSNDEIYKSIVRVVFHERRLQYIEREQLNLWKQTRPGERIVDIDIPLSYGLLDVKIDPRFLNCVDVVWNANKETSLFIKVHCISTEFTQHKHGGEKGVPFRIQIETYAVSNAGQRDDTQLVHCSSCQVKVFKPKGADRKHKRDMEKLLKTSDTEKARYHPVYPCTALTEIPLDQVTSYLVQLRKHHEEMARQCVDDATQQSTSCPIAESRSSFTVTDGTMESAAATKGINETQLASVNYVCNKFSDTSYSDRTLSCESLESMMPRTPQPLQKSGPYLKVSLASPYPTGGDPDELLPHFDNVQVADWLTRHRFTGYIKLFLNYSGSDLMSLSRSDLVELCGLSDGIRLNNALQARTIRPKLTIYICQDPPSKKVQTGTSTGLKKSLSWNLDKFLGSSSSSSRSESPVDDINSPSAFYQCNDPAVSSTMTSQTLMRAMSVGSFQQPLAPSGVGVTNDKHQGYRVPSGLYSAPNVAMATKRQYDATDTSFGELPLSKKRRTRIIDSVDDEVVYSAIYLEYLTCRHLIYKMSMIMGFAVDQITQLLVRGPSNISVIVTDSVIQNFIDQSRYSVHVVTDTRQSGRFYLVMKPASGY